MVWAVREEMASTLDDVLSRRLRALFLNAKAAIEMAPAVAKIMADELGLGQEWIEGEVSRFRTFAKKYQVVRSGTAFSARLRVWVAADRSQGSFLPSVVRMTLVSIARTAVLVVKMTPMVVR